MTRVDENYGRARDRRQGNHRDDTISSGTSEIEKRERIKYENLVNILRTAGPFSDPCPLAVRAPRIGGRVNARRRFCAAN